MQLKGSVPICASVRAKSPVALTGGASSVVGNNQKAVRALLASYHRIDAAQTDAGLWIEAMSARQWMNSATGDDIAANRDAVLQRGRVQVR